MTRHEWLETAVKHMVDLGMYEDTPKEQEQALCLAESLYDEAYDPIDSVNEELTYWGD